MQNVIISALVLVGLVLMHQKADAQEKKVKKPEYVIIADDEIITKDKLTEYGKKGYVKRMQKGVTQDIRNNLAKKYGDRIGEKEFIVLVDLHSEPERDKINQQKNNAVETQEENKEVKLSINDLAPDFTVKMINGSETTLSELKGKVILLNFWATWCAPCLKEFAEIPQKILEPFKNNQFAFIPISIGESKMKVQRKMTKMKKYGVDFNVGIDPKEKIWNQYAAGAIPKNFLIDKSGNVKYISVGYSEKNVDKLVTEIKTLLAQ